MSDSFDSRLAAKRAFIGSVVVILAVVAFVAGMVGSRPAHAQAPAFTAPPAPPAPDRPAAAPPAPREENPGLIDEIGKLWDKSSSMLPSLLPAKEPATEPAAPAAPAAPAVPPPPLARPAGATTAPPPVEAPPAAATPSTALVPSMVSGKMQCPTAANGAPDCQAGADKLCQSKGYASGKSLSSDSAEACSAKRLLPGRERKPDDCHTDYFVTRAFCQ
uniref:Uncharacterized protein n=1 Tax=Rhodopseudomonas palustris (strain BisA53) TaxID=316055 RepID=Q07TM1_RHOP5